METPQITQAEHFAHANEPLITFNPMRNLVYVNAVCLKRLPDMDYAHFLVFPAEKKLVLRPCGADERNAIRLRSGGKRPSKPRHIRCQAFMLKVLALTQWKPNERYRLLGNIVERNGETVVMFELKSRNLFEGFGVGFDEHLNNPLVKTFEQDAEIVVNNEEETRYE